MEDKKSNGDLRGIRSHKVTEYRKARRVHPYSRTKSRQKRQEKDYPTFDLPIKDLGELMKCHTTAFFKTTKKRRTINQQNMPKQGCRFSNYDFKRSSYQDAEMCESKHPSHSKSSSVVETSPSTSSSENALTSDMTFESDSGNISPTVVNKNHHNAGSDQKQQNAGTDNKQQTADTDKKQQNADTDKKQQNASIDKKQQNAGTNKNHQNAGTDKKQQIAGTDQKQQNAGTDKKQQIAGTDQKQQNAGFHMKQQNAGTNQKQQNAGTDKKQQNAGTNQKQQNAGTDKKQQDAGTDQKQQNVGTDKKQQNAGTDKKQQNAGTHQKQQIAGTDKKQLDAGTDQKQQNAGTDKKQQNVGTDKEHQNSGTDQKQKNVGTDFELYDKRGLISSEACVQRTFSDNSLEEGEIIDDTDDLYLGKFKKSDLVSYFNNFDSTNGCDQNSINSPNMEGFPTTGDLAASVGVVKQVPSQYLIVITDDELDTNDVEFMSMQSKDPHLSHEGSGSLAPYSTHKTFPTVSSKLMRSASSDQLANWLLTSGFVQMPDSNMDNDYDSCPEQVLNKICEVSILMPSDSHPCVCETTEGILSQPTTLTDQPPQTQLNVPQVDVQPEHCNSPGTPLSSYTHVNSVLKDQCPSRNDAAISSDCASLSHLVNKETHLDYSTPEVENVTDRDGLPDQQTQLSVLKQLISKVRTLQPKINQNAKSSSLFKAIKYIKERSNNFTTLNCLVKKKLSSEMSDCKLRYEKLGARVQEDDESSHDDDSVTTNFNMAKVAGRNKDSIHQQRQEDNWPLQPRKDGRLKLPVAEPKGQDREQRKIAGHRRKEASVSLKKHLHPRHRKRNYRSRISPDPTSLGDLAASVGVVVKQVPSQHLIVITDAEFATNDVEEFMSVQSKDPNLSHEGSSSFAPCSTDKTVPTVSSKLVRSASNDQLANWLLTSGFAQMPDSNMDNDYDSCPEQVLNKIGEVSILMPSDSHPCVCETTEGILSQPTTLTDQPPQTQLNVPQVDVQPEHCNSPGTPLSSYTHVNSVLKDQCPSRNDAAISSDCALLSHLVNKETHLDYSTPEVENVTGRDGLPDQQTQQSVPKHLISKVQTLQPKINQNVKSSSLLKAFKCIKEKSKSFTMLTSIEKKKVLAERNDCKLRYEKLGTLVLEEDESNHHDDSMTTNMHLARVAGRNKDSMYHKRQEDNWPLQLKKYSRFKLAVAKPEGQDGEQRTIAGHRRKATHVRVENLHPHHRKRNYRSNRISPDSRSLEKSSQEVPFKPSVSAQLQMCAHLPQPDNSTNDTRSVTKILAAGECVCEFEKGHTLRSLDVKHTDPNASNLVTCCQQQPAQIPREVIGAKLKKIRKQMKNRVPNEISQKIDMSLPEPTKSCTLSSVKCLCSRGISSAKNRFHKDSSEFTSEPKSSVIYEDACSQSATAAFSEHALCSHKRHQPCRQIAKHVYETTHFQPTQCCATCDCLKPTEGELSEDLLHPAVHQSQKQPALIRCCVETGHPPPCSAQLKAYKLPLQQDFTHFDAGVSPCCHSQSDHCHTQTQCVSGNIQQESYRSHFMSYAHTSCSSVKGIPRKRNHSTSLGSSTKRHCPDPTERQIASCKWLELSHNEVEKTKDCPKGDKSFQHAQNLRLHSTNEEHMLKAEILLGCLIKEISHHARQSPQDTISRQHYSPADTCKNDCTSLEEPSCYTSHIGREDDHDGNNPLKKIKVRSHSRHRKHRKKSKVVVDSPDVADHKARDSPLKVNKTHHTKSRKTGSASPIIISSDDEDSSNQCYSYQGKLQNVKSYSRLEEYVRKANAADGSPDKVADHDAKWVPLKVKKKHAKSKKKRRSATHMLKSDDEENINQCFYSSSKRRSVRTHSANKNTKEAKADLDYVVEDTHDDDTWSPLNMYKKYHHGKKSKHSSSDIVNSTHDTNSTISDHYHDANCSPQTSESIRSGSALKEHLRKAKALLDFNVGHSCHDIRWTPKEKSSKRKRKSKATVLKSHDIKKLPEISMWADVIESQKNLP